MRKYAIVKLAGMFTYYGIKAFEPHTCKNGKQVWRLASELGHTKTRSLSKCQQTAIDLGLGQLPIGSLHNQPIE